MRIAIVLFTIVLLGAGCTEDFVASTRNTTNTIQAKVAEISATFAKAKAVYDILYPSPSETTPSVPPTEDQPQPATAENTSSPLPPPTPDASTDQSP